MDVDLDITDDLDVSVEEDSNNNQDAKEEEDNNIDVLCVQTFQNDKFFLCGVTFWASLRCGKAYGSSKLLLQLNFFHNLFIVCIGKAFTQPMLLVPLRSHCSRNC